MKKRLALLMALGLAVSPTVTVLATENTANRADLLREMYGEIEKEYQPGLRWWIAQGFNTDDTLNKSIEEMADNGFGSFEFAGLPEAGVDRTIYGWGSEEWLSDSRLILDKAAELGMSAGVTAGACCSNANLPVTFEYDGQAMSGDNKASSKELDYATVKMAAGESYSGELPLAKPLEAFGSDEGLKGCTADYKENIFMGAVAVKTVEARAESGQDFEYGEGTGTGVLELGSVVDLSSQVTEQDGKYMLDWTAPDDGDYTLFVYWMHGTCQIAGATATRNFTINHVDSYGYDALRQYWDETLFNGETAETLKESGNGEFYIDSLEVSTYGAGGMYWGYHFKEEFQKRKGYDITPYLPFMTKEDGQWQSHTAIAYDYVASTEEDSSIIEKVQHDYYSVLTELYMENTLQPMQEWLHSKNMKLRTEPSYGFNAEISLPAAYLDQIETESFAENADVDLYRGLLGAANMYDLRYSSETGAMFYNNYCVNMDEWTQLCFLQFVNGVSHNVFHGYSNIEGPDGNTFWPGHEGMYPMFPERFGDRQPASEMYDDWTAMLGRLQKALQQGTASRDIAILRTDYNFINYGASEEMGDFRNNYQMNDIPYFWTDYELQHNGYTYDYFSPLLLLDEENVSWNSEALMPDGVGYKALVLYQEAIELESAQKILEIAKDGLPVLFVNNNREMISQDFQYKEHKTAASVAASLSYADEDVQAVVNEIKALPNVRTVESPEDAMEALQEMGVYPRVAYEEENDNILTISRNDRENDLYYTYAYAYKFNKEDAAYPTTFTMKIEGEGKPYLLNAWTGEVEEIGVYEVADGHTNVTMTLDAGECAMVILDRANTEEGLHAVSTTADDIVVKDGKVSLITTASGEYDTMLNNGETVKSETIVPENISLDKWNITVEDWSEGEKVTKEEEKFDTHTTTEVYYETKKTPLTFENMDLVAWKDLPATEEQLELLSGETPSMSDVSGIGYYTTTFTLPENWTDTTGAYLQMESANGGIVEVTVNGQKAPAVDMRSLKTDISDLLIPGENTVEIKVATTLHNRLLDMGYGDGEKWGWTSAGWSGEDLEVHDYGLVGKVEVVPFTVTEIA